MTTTTTSRTMRLSDRASVLRFTGADDACPDGPYHCRGGICWPRPIDKAGSVLQGFAVMCGLHLATRRAYVLAQTPFVAIDHVQDEQGAIQFQGLSTWLIDCWSSWFADTFYWKQPWETNRRYLQQVLRSPMIQPKPHFVALEWAEDSDAWSAVYEAEATDRLRYQAGSPLHVALSEFAAAEPQDKPRFPAVHALTCALFALQSVMPRKERTP